MREYLSYSFISYVYEKGIDYAHTYEEYKRKQKLSLSPESLLGTLVDINIRNKNEVNKYPDIYVMNDPLPNKGTHMGDFISNVIELFLTEGKIYEEAKNEAFERLQAKNTKLEKLEEIFETKYIDYYQAMINNQLIASLDLIMKSDQIAKTFYNSVPDYSYEKVYDGSYLDIPVKVFLDNMHSINNSEVTITDYKVTSKTLKQFITDIRNKYFIQEWLYTKVIKDKYPNLSVKFRFLVQLSENLRERPVEIFISDTTRESCMQRLEYTLSDIKYNYDQHGFDLKQWKSRDSIYV